MEAFREYSQMWILTKSFAFNIFRFLKLPYSFVISISVFKFFPFLYMKAYWWKPINFLKCTKALIKKEKTTDTAVNEKIKT